MSNPLEIVSLIFSVLYYLGKFLVSLWWVYLPILLFWLIKDFWLKNKREEFIKNMKWVLLEVKPPREVARSAFAMEQFFAGLYPSWSSPNTKEMILEGATQKWFSLEMASFAGEIHFFIRTLESWRNVVEANIYAQYPEAEITQVNDYVDNLPDDLLNQDYDLFGAELQLLKEDAYPIRTYPVFEKTAKSEERIDPISTLLEIMSQIKEGEQIWIQTLIRPVPDAWKKEGEALMEKLLGRTKPKERGLLMKEAIGWKDAAKSVIHHVISGQPFEIPADEAKKDSPLFMVFATKGEQEVIYAIDQNLSKLGYETIIRFIYVGRRDVFKRPTYSGILGAYLLFNTQNLNGFKPNSQTVPFVDYKYQLKSTRLNYRKKRVYRDYKKRYFVQYSKNISYLKPLLFERLPILKWFFQRTKLFVLNIEELATVYHFPGVAVKAPLTPKVESKKAEPPMGLPIQ